MTKLWHKPHSQPLHPMVESFLSAEDVQLDSQLAVYDITGSLGHLEGLLDAGIVNANEYQSLKQGLTVLLTTAQQSGLPVTIADEDIHTVVEQKLKELVGDVADKLHTGRSRNDQIATDLKLYAKDQLHTVMQQVQTLITASEQCVAQHGNLPLPGYTHIQRAMPSSIGLWLGATVAGLQDDLSTLKHAYVLNDQCPLGSAAGYGTPLHYNKTLVAEKLGFATVQDNPLYCQNSRGKIELVTVHALQQVILTVNKLATDLMLFTTSEFGFFTLPDTLLTGSSIMAQKKNYDVLELLRAKVAGLSGQVAHITGIITNLPSGYNRDFQEQKKPLMQSFQTVQASLPVATLVVGQLQPNVEKLKRSITPDLLVTQQVYDLVAQGVPFRKAYQQVGAQYQAGIFHSPATE